MCPTGGTEMGLQDEKSVERWDIFILDYRLTHTVNLLRRFLLYGLLTKSIGGSNAGRKAQLSGFLSP